LRTRIGVGWQLLNVFSAEPFSFHGFSIFEWITVILWIAAAAWLVAGAKTANEGVRAADAGALTAISRTGKVLAMLVMFLVIYVPQWFHLRAPPENRSALAGIAGVAVCLAGLLLFVSSRRALGRNWSDQVVVKEGHEVVRRGPYRWVRHPLYVGLVLALLGSAATVGARAGYLMIALCFLGIFFKSKREEAMLSRRLPGYAEYKQHVKGFIPHVF
jgi:protein-S-isoprenylcysteine O-methyltransferase Ste14